MKVNQVNPKRSSFAGVGRISEIHKKTTSTGTTFRANRRSLGRLGHYSKISELFGGDMSQRSKISAILDEEELYWP